MWYVYILLCEDGVFYTGISNNLEKRFLDHQKGLGAKFTRSHKPVKIIYRESLPTRSAALKRENVIKLLSRQKKMEMICAS